MATKNWKRLAKGIRYYEHPTRKIQTQAGKRLDRYHSVRWTRNGTTKEEGIGWESDGITEEFIMINYHTLRLNYKLGKKPSTFKELVAENKKIEEEKKIEAQKEADHNITMDTFFYKYFLPWKKLNKIKSRKEERKRYELRAKHAFGDLPLHKVTPKMLDDFMTSMRNEDLAEATVLLHMAIIRQIYNRAKKTFLPHGGVAFEGDSPVNKIDLPKTGRRNARTGKLSLAKFEQVLVACLDKSEAASTNEQNKIWQDLFDALIVAAYTGLRLGEIQRLTWGAIDFERSEITIEEQKNDEKNEIAAMPLIASDTLMDRWLNTKKVDPDQLVFPPYRRGKERFDKKTKEPLPQYNHLIPRKFSKLMNELKFNTPKTHRLNRIVFHSLRHTFASWLSSKNVPLKEIQAAMRHKSIEMTLRYTHSVEENRHTLINRLDSFDHDHVFRKTE